MLPMRGEREYIYRLWVVLFPQASCEASQPTTISDYGNIAGSASLPFDITADHFPKHFAVYISWKPLDSINFSIGIWYSTNRDLRLGRERSNTAHHILLWRYLLVIYIKGWTHLKSQAKNSPTSMTLISINTWID